MAWQSFWGSLRGVPRNYRFLCAFRTRYSESVRRVASPWPHPHKCSFQREVTKKLSFLDRTARPCWVPAGRSCEKILRGANSPRVSHWKFR
jgi:hypothetical protein